MDRYIQTQENLDLSGKDIQRITNDAVKITPYHELRSNMNIDELFGDKPCAMLLYETKENFGHWVAMIKQNGFLEFFDSYGLKVDEELNYAKYDTNATLTQILQQSKVRIVYNDVKLQVFKEDVNTCGRWTAFRIVMRDTPLKQFQQLFKGVKHYNGDFFITALTLIFTLHKQN
tara:strand:+ start:18268 stop:18789 length:522 start_codon:yes stop_codon:yes gene_type:complete